MLLLTQEHHQLLPTGRLEAAWLKAGTSLLSPSSAQSPDAATQPVRWWQQYWSQWWVTQPVWGNSKQQVLGKRDDAGRLAMVCVQMCG